MIEIDEYKRTTQNIESVLQQSKQKWIGAQCDKFYKEYISPLKKEFSDITKAMEKLEVEIGEIKREVDMI